MNFLRADTVSKPATSKETTQRAEAISRFYADLVETSGSRWTDTPDVGGAVDDKKLTHTLPADTSLQEPDQVLDRASVTPAGVVILGPAASRGDETVEELGRGVQSPNSQAAGAIQYGISRRNVGYQLLQKAGWKEGTGLGVQEQGRRQPLAPAAVQGQAGLGFRPLAVPRHQPGRPVHEDFEGRRNDGEAKLPVQPPAPKRPLPPDPLEKEDVEVKVKRVKQVMQAEADEKAGKAIQRYMYMAFNDATGEPTSDSNPLLRRGRSKLSATNPLL